MKMKIKDSGLMRKGLLTKKSWYLILLFIVVVITILTGCAKTQKKEPGAKKPAVEDPKAGGTYIHPLIADPKSLDPPHVYESESYRVAVMIFDGLVDYDPKTLEIKPALAESWEVSDDAKVWTFKLKKGVKYHIGGEVKAEDFKKCWERACARETESEVAYVLSPILGYDEMQKGEAKELSGVKVIDDYTLEVTLKHPFGEFLKTLGHPVASVYPPEEAEELGDKFSESPVGTGPFKLVSWKHNREVVLERNDNYWGKKAFLDKIIFRIFKDENTAFLEYKAGKIHDCGVPTGQIKSTKTDPILGPQYREGPEIAIYFYGFNMEKGVFAKDKNLRLAIAHSTNKQAIVDVVMEGLPTIATGIVPPGVPGYKAGSAYEQDKEKAKRYWEKSSKPKKITLWYNTSEGHQKIAEVAQAGYKAVGINVELANLDWGAYLDKVSKSETEFFRMGWLADYPSMDNFLYPLFHSSEKGNNNMFFYGNPEVDKLLEDARKEVNDEKRYDLYAQAEKKILQDVPLVPIYFYKFARVVQPEVNGYHWSAMGLVNFDEVWLTKAEKK